MTTLDFNTTTVTNTMKLANRVRNKYPDRRHKRDWTKAEWFRPGIYQHVVTTYHLEGGRTIDKHAIHFDLGYQQHTLGKDDGQAYQDLMRWLRPIDSDEVSEDSIKALMRQEQIEPEDLLAILTKVAVAASLKPADIQAVMKNHVEEYDEN